MREFSSLHKKWIEQPQCKKEEEGKEELPFGR